MRSFYKQILEDFHIYCGNRSQMRDWTDEDIAKLLDVLCKVSEVYSYIPKADQQRIIEAQLIKDVEYTTLNARTVSRWLELNGKHYFKQDAHQQNKQPENYRPLEGEERDRYIKIAMEAVANLKPDYLKNPIKGNGERMREQLDQAGIIHNPTPKETSALEDEVGVICELCKQHPCVCR